MTEQTNNPLQATQGRGDDAGNSQQPIIVIAGPTASGKTALAIRLAEKFQGEIICADSRTVYKGMDIGTAKPTVKEQAAVPHWGLDLVEPGEPFSAAEFKKYALQKVVEIHGRGRVPFIVGGTGLYIDGIIFDFQFAEKPTATRRSELERKSHQELYDYCHKNNIKLPENLKNRRYLIRAIERGGENHKRRYAPRANVFVVGIATKTEVLRSRIEQRAQTIVTNSVVKEATTLGQQYGWNTEAMTGNIYPLVAAYGRGEINNDELRCRFVVRDWHLAKRQLTWLRRNPFLMWCDLESAEHYLSQILVGWGNS